MREIQRTLQMICKRCSRVMLPTPQHYEYYTQQMRSAIRDRRKAMKINDDLLEMTKRVRCCPWCNARNGQVKKVPGLLKIVHDLRQKETKKDRERKLEEEEQRKRLIREKFTIQRQIQQNVATGQNLHQNDQLQDLLLQPTMTSTPAGFGMTSTF
eukprot:UN03947